MSTIELRTNLHHLIDDINNPALLESLVEILTQRKESEDGHLWETLSESQKKEVLEAFEESKDSKNLTPHSEVLRKFK